MSGANHPLARHRRRRAVGALLLGTLLSTGAGSASARAQQSADEPFTEVLRRASAASESGRWEEAAGLWRRVVGINPVNADYWAALGRSLYGAGRLNESIAPLERAMRLGAWTPGTPASSAYAVAAAHARLGRADSALVWLDRALRMGYRDLAAVRADTMFAALRDNPRFRLLVALAYVKKMTPTEGRRFDLRLLAREMRRLHYGRLRASDFDFTAAVAAIERDLPRLSDDEFTVSLMRLTTLAGDGHTFMMSVRTSPDGRLLVMPPFEAAPVLFFRFGDGLYVIGGEPRDSALVGMQVVRVNGRDTRTVLAAVEQLVSYDNTQWIRFMETDYVRRPGVLHGLGFGRSRDTLRLTLRDSTGRMREVSYAAQLAASDLTWRPFPVDSTRPLYLRNRQRNYWFTYLPDSRTVYFQYNRVMPDPAEPFDRFTDRLFALIDSKPVGRLVVDVRWNPGGNTYMSLPLVKRIASNPKLNRPGSLFIIIGRETFSAAQNTVTMLEKWAKPIFVGEPTGSSPNFVGETVLVELPYTGLTASVSDLYWQTSWPEDHRTWIAPTLYAPPTIEAFRAGRDPALDAILSYK